MGKGYSFSADYWSIGITMFEIFYGYVPFGQSAKGPMDIYYQILNKKLILPYEPKFNVINNFFKIILSKNLMQRVCNFNLLKSHEFFNKFDFEKLENFTLQAPFIPDINKLIAFNSDIINNCTNPIVEHIQQSLQNNEEEIQKKFSINEDLQNNINNFLKQF